MDRPDPLKEEASRRLAHAKQMRADADIARERSTERRKMAKSAKDIAKRLCAEGAKVPVDAFSQPRNEPILAMAERHVMEAEGHVERQRKLIEVLIRDKHERMVAHARKILEILEQSQKLARMHLALEREFNGVDVKQKPPAGLTG